MNKDEIINDIKKRIKNEHRKHPSLNWEKFAAIKIYETFLDSEFIKGQAKHQVSGGYKTITTYHNTGVEESQYSYNICEEYVDDLKDRFLQLKNIKDEKFREWAKENDVKFIRSNLITEVVTIDEL